MTTKALFESLRSIIKQEWDQLKKLHQENRGGTLDRSLDNLRPSEQVVSILSLSTRLSTSVRNVLNEAGIAFSCGNGVGEETNVETLLTKKANFENVIEIVITIFAPVRVASLSHRCVDGTLLALDAKLSEYLRDHDDQLDREVFSNPYQIRLNQLRNRHFDDTVTMEHLDSLQEVVRKERVMTAIERSPGMYECPLCLYRLSSDIVNYCESCGQRVVLPSIPAMIQ